MPRQNQIKVEGWLAYCVFVIGMVLGFVFTAVGVVIGVPIAFLFGKKIEMGDADLTI